jgi:hypothetical protein
MYVQRYQWIVFTCTLCDTQTVSQRTNKNVQTGNLRTGTEYMRHLQMSMGINPFLPNNLQSRQTVSTLNRQMTYKEVPNSVSKFGGILFTPIR